MPEMMGEGGNKLDVNLIAMGVPGGKVGQVEDIANGVVYLASDASGYVNGSSWLLIMG